MSTEYSSDDASLCTLFVLSTCALSYTCTVSLVPRAPTSMSKRTASRPSKPPRSHRAGDFTCLSITVPFPSLCCDHTLIARIIIPSYYVYVQYPNYVLGHRSFFFLS